MDPQRLLSLFYFITGLVCCLITIIVLNRVKATKYKETVDKGLCNILIFFIAFTLVDALWGFVGAYLASKAYISYTIATYLFHIFAAFSGFFVSLYAVNYLKIKPSIKKIFLIYRFVLIAVQLTFIIINMFSDNFWFVIDTEGVYHTISQNIRRVVFFLQFAHVIPIIIFAIVKAITRKRKNKTIYLSISGIIFLVIPIIFGVLQMLFPDGPFYSLGFTVFSVAVYAFNVTSQREEYLNQYLAMEEAKKSSETISKALKIAEDANKAKSVFLANMSHDIRTPINGIMGVTSLLEKEEMSDKAKEYVKKIDGASHHLLSLVNDVLDMSLIEAKNDALLNIEPMDIKIIVDNCTSIISGQLLSRKLKFEVKYLSKTEHSSVLGDNLRLRQILINIIGNAVKFTSDNGKVNFYIKEVHADQNIVTYEFTIEDTGIGMSQEFIEHIFEPFSQATQDSRTKYKGTGLGMSIAKQLVDLMKGTIVVTSELGKGSKFVVTIPFLINTNEKVVEEKVPQLEDISIKGTRILLVEDNELNMEIAATLLEQQETIITKAFNGQEAIDIFSKSKEDSFDVILMDIMMPIKNGYEATKEIRELDRADAKMIPIIAMTANAFDEDKKQALLAGMSAHIAKPIEIKTVVKEIYRFTNKK